MRTLPRGYVYDIGFENCVIGMSSKTCYSVDDMGTVLQQYR